MKAYVCKVCGYVHFGEEAPEKCPQCGAGKDKFEDLFKGIKKGLYAKKMGGGSVNPQTGEFNFAVNEGYMIIDGKITYPVKGASLIGNGAEILMNIDVLVDGTSKRDETITKLS